VTTQQIAVDDRAGARSAEAEVAPPLGELLSRLGDDVGQLISAELRLATVEMREDAKQAARASALVAAAGVLGFVTLLLLAWAAAWGLAEVLPEGVAFLVVGVVFGIVASVVGLIGRMQLQRTNLVPEQTITTLKEDVQWARRQAS
jgi:uncharacterized membrane protein YqjE